MGTRLEGIPQALRALPRWVCAEDGSKVPQTAFQPGCASVGSPMDWSEWEVAAGAVEAGAYPWLGFVFAEGDGLVGVDIDGAFDDDGLPDPLAAEAVARFASYTEVSRSGRGLHIVCRGRLPFRGRNWGGWEAYASGRWFLLTGRRAFGSGGDVREAQGAIDWLLATLAPRAAEPPRGGGRARLWQPAWPGAPQGRFPAAPAFPTAREGERHLCLVSAAGQLAQAGAGPGLLRRRLAEINRLHVEPPVPDAEVESIARSVRRL